MKAVTVGWGYLPAMHCRCQTTLKSEMEALMLRLRELEAELRVSSVCPMDYLNVGHTMGFSGICGN